MQLFFQNSNQHWNVCCWLAEWSLLFYLYSIWFLNHTRVDKGRTKKSRITLRVYAVHLCHFVPGVLMWTRSKKKKREEIEEYTWSSGVSLEKVHLMWFIFLPRGKDSVVTVLSPPGRCCQKSRRDQIHLAPPSLGLNLTLVPSIDRSMWSLVSLTDVMVASLKRFDFVELLVFKNDKVCAIGFQKKNCMLYFY